jgi:hypothetical protein
MMIGCFVSSLRKSASGEGGANSTRVGALEWESYYGTLKGFKKVELVGLWIFVQKGISKNNDLVVEKEVEKCPKLRGVREPNS